MKNSKMKKLIAVVSAAVMACAMSMTAMAAPSPQASGTATISAATDANGNAVNVSIAGLDSAGQTALSQINSTSALSQLLGSAYVEGMRIVDAQEVSVPAGTVFPVTITFSVPGVTPSSRVAVLHYTGSVWESVPCTAGNGTITATFNSLSPVAFVVGGTTSTTSTTAATGTTSPKTGESFAVIGFGVVAILAAVGAFGLTRKKRA